MVALCVELILWVELLVDSVFRVFGVICGLLR